MHYALMFTFDPQTEQLIRNVWAELDASSVAPFMHHSGLHPHVTIAGYDSLDLQLCQPLIERWLSENPPLPVVFQHLGIFPGEQPVVFLEPTHNRVLLELHSNLHQLTTPIASPLDETHYRPDLWVAHLTLALSFEPAALPEILQVASRLPMPIHARAEKIQLISYPPVQSLFHLPFTGG